MVSSRFNSAAMPSASKVRAKSSDPGVSSNTSNAPPSRSSRTFTSNVFCARRKSSGSPSSSAASPCDSAAAMPASASDARSRCILHTPSRPAATPLACSTSILSRDAISSRSAVNPFSTSPCSTPPLASILLMSPSTSARKRPASEVDRRRAPTSASMSSCAADTAPRSSASCFSLAAMASCSVSFAVVPRTTATGGSDA
mmetsp:Transcript_4228/g.10355  ORF Transcript_4228/g.10355 Transcript_4228/m.10355 type:complete len:200 (+) Transcript_4228:274-873(+)